MKKAAQKTSEYEAALRAARAETYKELEQLRRQLQDDRAASGYCPTLPPSSV